MAQRIKVISLGWGVQSWTMAAMVALGELPPVDYAIHADTTWERDETYNFAARWTPWLQQQGVNVITVRDKSVRSIMNDKNIFVPAYTMNGTQGRLRRQCTSRWKIDPIRRFLRQRHPKTRFEMWLGITIDEIERAKDSRVGYIDNTYPLLNRRMTRQDCVSWLGAHSLPVPPKSACVFCPFHSPLAWDDLRRAGGADWETAVMVDEAIRDKRPGYKIYVNRNCKPLRALENYPEQTRFGFVEDVPCDSGYCFL